jgi:hypothetical protein
MFTFFDDGPLAVSIWQVIAWAQGIAIFWMSVAMMRLRATKTDMEGVSKKLSEAMGALEGVKSQLCEAEKDRQRSLESLTGKIEVLAAKVDSVDKGFRYSRRDEGGISDEDVRSLIERLKGSKRKIDMY